jgi:hypothetical protein
VSCKRAFCPSAVVNPAYPPSGGGLTARVVGISAKQVHANAANAG